MGIDPMNNISDNNKNTLCSYIISTHIRPSSSPFASSVTSEEEGWNYEDVHRLQGNEQEDHKKLIPNTYD
jgi:hypothetical protein